MKGTQFFLLHFFGATWIGEEWSKEMRLAGASLGTFLVYVAEPQRPVDPGSVCG